MKKATRKLCIAAAAAGVCLSLFSGPVLAAEAEEEAPSAELSVDVLSQYIWRGFAFSRNSVVIQPSMTVGYKGFSANIWGNLDTDPYSVSSDEKSNWNETDLTLAYDWAMGPVSMTGGYIYYGLEGVNDTQEIFLSAGLDTLLSPTLTVYKDIANLSGWYVTLGVSHAVPISGDIALELGAQAGYLRANEPSSYEEVDGNGNGTGKAYRALHDGVISAALPIPVGKYMTVTPKVSYSFALSGDASDLLKNTNDGAIAKRDANFFYGGIALGMAF